MASTSVCVFVQIVISWKTEAVFDILLILERFSLFQYKPPSSESSEYLLKKTVGTGISLG